MGICPRQQFSSRDQILMLTLEFARQPSGAQERVNMAPDAC